MYKLIFADDEQVVRNSIMKIINWEECGFTVTACCENGREVIEKVEKDCPDVIITDIKMPFMDGVELASIVRSKHPTVKIVFLTGFDDFNYAKQAIDLNVMDYILKPITSRKLTKSLLQIKEKLDKEYKEKNDLDLLRLYYKKSLPLLKHSFLTTLVKSNIPQKTIDERIDSLKFGELRGDRYVVTVVNVDDETFYNTSFSLKELDIALFAAFNITQEVVNKYSIGVSFMYEQSIVIIAKSDKNDSILEQGFDEILEEIRHNVKKYLGFSITIGVGNICNTLEGVKTSFNNAILALEYKIILGNNRVIYIDDLEPNRKNIVIFDDNKERMLLTAIKVGTIEEVEKTIDNLVNEIVESKMSLNYIHFYIMGIMSALYKEAQNSDVDIEKFFGNNNVMTEIFKIKSIKEIKYWLKNICIKIMNAISKNRRDTCKVLVERAKHYIMDNYSNSDISVKMVSSYLHISPSYFGAIFKRETGETFVDFLVKIRMRKAKQLICTTDYKNYEIASKIGYSNPHYFSYSFKKYYNISPNEFRNSLKHKLEDNLNE